MLKFYAFQLWEWLVVHGLPLTALVIIAILIPRVGRLAIRIVSSRFDEGEEATKSRLALVGALVYVLQAIAYFAIIMLGLTNLGVPAMGAALPATVVSAAIGFGAQNVIGDFLAGFFIISERQFGVGDFVAFDGTSNDISGTVVGLTLRATKVRTASGEVVTIPNGSAGVITNYSQDWSRAVVDLAVPLQPGESMSQLTDRVEATAAKALGDPTIAGDVTGELEVLPATDIVAPSAAGQSWQVNFRVMVVVNPARQWAVERVLRSALVNVFWDRYDMPRVFLDGSDAHSSPAADPRKAVAADSALAPTEVLPAQHASRNRSASVADGSQSGSAGTGSGSAGIADSVNEDKAHGSAAGSEALAAHGTASTLETAAMDAVQAEGTDRASQLARPGEAAQGEKTGQPAEAPTADGPGIRPLDSDGTIGRTRPAPSQDATSAASPNATPSSDDDAGESGAAAGTDATSSSDDDAGEGGAAAGTDGAKAAASGAGVADAAAGGAGVADAAAGGTGRAGDGIGVNDSEENAGEENAGEEDADEKKEKFKGIWRNEEHSSKFKRIMSVGGRTRPSTTGLILALLLVGGLALASSNPEGGDTGWLSPDYWRDRPSNSESSEGPENSEGNDQSGDNSTTDPNSDPNSSANTDGNTDGNTDANPDGNTDSNTNGNAGSNTNSNSGANSGANSDQNANSNPGGNDGSPNGTANEPNSNSSGNNRNSGNGGVQNNSNNSGTGGNSVNGAAPRAMGAPNATDITHG